MFGLKVNFTIVNTVLIIILMIIVVVNCVKKENYLDQSCFEDKKRFKDCLEYQTLVDNGEPTSKWSHKKKQYWQWCQDMQERCYKKKQINYKLTKYPV